MGVIKKTAIEKFANVRLSGLASIKLDDKDQLVWAKTTSGNDQIFLVSRHGKCIRFNEGDTRPMGRHTRGVKGITLKAGDELVSMDVLPQRQSSPSYRHLLVIADNGVGKRSDAYLYPLQKRGGLGVKASNLSSKTGFIAVAAVVSEKDNEVIIISKKAITIKLPLKDIPVLSRNTRGVILMRLKSADDKVNAMTILAQPEIENNIGQVKK
jgi:DNA gyrase subunit A